MRTTTHARRARLQFCALSTALLAAGIGLAGMTPAQAANGPNMQLPFPCNQKWVGNNSNSSAHKTSYEFDFNRGSSPSADKGDTVSAAAAGTVRTSRHQGSANGYGNLVTIDHGSYVSYYAHLNSRSVSAGAKVRQGQKIGTVGNTSKPGNNVSPHLHFEVRRDGGTWPSNLVRPVFNGNAYSGGSITSRNACSGTSTPAFPGTSAFQLGKAHDAVLTLDRALIRKGYTKYHDGDGYQAGRTFTSYTKANVRSFQLAQGWTGADADGYPGPETWRRLVG